MICDLETITLSQEIEPHGESTGSLLRSCPQDADWKRCVFPQVSQGGKCGCSTTFLVSKPALPSSDALSLFPFTYREIEVSYVISSPTNHMRHLSWFSWVCCYVVIYTYFARFASSSLQQARNKLLGSVPRRRSKLKLLDVSATAKTTDQSGSGEDVASQMWLIHSTLCDGYTVRLAVSSYLSPSTWVVRG